MQEQRFDHLTKVMGSSTSRRSLLKLALGAVAGSALSVVGISRPEKPLLPHETVAQEDGNDPFLRTWERTDKPVADGQAVRTWMWGPEAFTEIIDEPYAESPGGIRQVQYYDKSRMEITDPGGDAASIWYVTNGLLSTELITGRMQVGDNEFVERSPAAINVAGDADDPNGPTYASFAQLLDQAPLQVGSTVTQRVDRAGLVTEDPSLAGQGVTVALIDDVTNHGIATPFWNFMNSSGVIYENGAFTDGPLFTNAYFATGRPISEPVWASVRVGGAPNDVLVQCFERRCLTFTPDNASEWQVEAGNVGQHYYDWRYVPLLCEGVACQVLTFDRTGQAVTADGCSDNCRQDVLLANAMRDPAYLQLRDVVVQSGYLLSGDTTALDVRLAELGTQGMILITPLTSADSGSDAGSLVYAETDRFKGKSFAAFTNQAQPYGILVDDNGEIQRVDTSTDTVNEYYSELDGNTRSLRGQGGGERNIDACTAGGHAICWVGWKIGCAVVIGRCALLAVEPITWPLAVACYLVGRKACEELVEQECNFDEIKKICCGPNGTLCRLPSTCCVDGWQCCDGTCIPNGERCDSIPCENITGMFEQCSRFQQCCPGGIGCWGADNSCPDCLLDEHCQGEGVCIDQVCTCGPNETPCSSPDSANLCCPAGWQCSPGQGCEPPAECPTGMVWSALHGVCEPPDDDPPEECPTGTFWSALQGVCLADCADGRTVCGHRPNGSPQCCPPGDSWTCCGGGDSWEGCCPSPAVCCPGAGCAAGGNCR